MPRESGAIQGGIDTVAEDVKPLEAGTIILNLKPVLDSKKRSRILFCSNMKKLLDTLLLTALLVTVTHAHAYMINGVSARLLSCEWGPYGNEYGYLGTYEAISGNRYTIYFGVNYCEH